MRVLVLSCTILMLSVLHAQIKDQYLPYVNPLIGTSKMGHVFPGATVPFGMVQVSPQTNFMPLFLTDGSYNKAAYDYCAGYQYADSNILGFAHTNFSGTGHSDLGDILIMPTIGPIDFTRRNELQDHGYSSPFSHDREKASPGYYEVVLDQHQIKAEMTATERVGFHRYTFPKNEEATILLDMVYNIYHHAEKNVWTFLRIENDSTITGYRQTNGWARDRKVFFVIRLSQPILHYGFQRYDKNDYKGFYRRFNEKVDFPEIAGKNVRAWFNFNAVPNEPIMIKVALSSVSCEGAMLNLESELSHWKFEEVVRKAQEKWDVELSKIQVEMLDTNDRINFYTALYHTNLSPILYEDVDGKYRGLDQNIHVSEGFTNHTIFSLWDTYRALHPLFNLIQQERNNDMIKSMLAHQSQSVHGMLPIWSHYANENWCMIGYHATSVIADAVVKKVGDFDVQKALDACTTTANVPYFEGIGPYLTYGYVPDDLSHSSVSKTLEYAYDDWCIAQIAHRMGDAKTSQEFLKRSTHYENVYDATIGFMRPRVSTGQFRQAFDPMDTHGQGFIEGNAWNYGLYVPQDVPRMVNLMGGKRRMTQHLDSLFTMEIDDKYIEKNEDITRDGIIGNYVHGNEPSHHIPYLYNWTGHPEKTQKTVRMVMDEMYSPTIDGLCGNDDAGQMSAWYIFSALGFYPVTPGSTIYAIGSPLVVNAKITLPENKVLVISTKNQSRKNVYVKAVRWNGKMLKTPFIDHHELVQGGTLEFLMNDKPINY